MSWVLVLCGSVFVLLGIVGLIGPRVSERRRRLVEATGSPAWGPLLPMAAGAAVVAAGIIGETWAYVGAAAAFVVVGVLSKRMARAIEDPPPLVARQRDRSLNPVRQIVHPVASTRETAELFRFKRNRAEQRAWEEARGIRPKPDA